MLFILKTRANMALFGGGPLIEKKMAGIEKTSMDAIEFVK